MHRYVQLLCFVWVVGVVPSAAAQMPPTPPDPPPPPPPIRYLDRLDLSPTAVSFEIDYEGSPHTGAYQTMKVTAYFIETLADGSEWEVWENVSGQCYWEFSDRNIYAAYTGDYGNLSDAGLVISWEWGPIHAGSTGVTVYYEDQSVSGTITATDSRPPG